MPPGLDFPRGAEFWMPVVPILAGGTPPNTIDPRHASACSMSSAALRPGLDAAASAPRWTRPKPVSMRADPGRLKWGATTVVTPFVDHVFGPVRPALARAVGRGRRAAADRLRQRLGPDADARVAAAPRSTASGWRSARPRGASRGSGCPRSLLVAAAGGVLGLAVAHWIARAIVALAPDDLPRVADIAVDTTVALFTFAAVLRRRARDRRGPAAPRGRATTCVAALEGERTTAGRGTLRARSTLLVVQIGLSVVLLVAAGLVLRSFLALRQVDLGFTPDRVLSAHRAAGESEPPAERLAAGFADAGPHAAGRRGRRRRLPAPADARTDRPGRAVLLEGQPETREAAEANPDAQPPDRDARILRGDEDPAAGRPVLHRSRHRRRAARRDRQRVHGAAALARPGSDRQAALDGELHARQARQGVAHGRRRRQRRALPRASRKCSSTSTIRRCRSAGRRTTSSCGPSGDPLALAGPVRAIARELDPAAIVDAVTTMDAVVGRAEAPWRLTMWMFVLFAALAFGLAALGLFSLVALDVAHRGREFAIRHGARRIARRHPPRRAGAGRLAGAGRPRARPRQPRSSRAARCAACCSASPQTTP